MKMAYWAAPATRGKEILDVISPLLADLQDTTGKNAGLFRAVKCTTGSWHRFMPDPPRA